MIKISGNIWYNFKEIDVSKGTVMKRVLRKLSGEALAGEKGQGFDEDTCVAVANQVKKIVDKGVQVAIVIGGGNFWRGRTSNKIDRPKADGIGMLATIMNCMYVSEIFRTEGMGTEVYTPFACGTWTKLFSKDAAVADLEEGKVVFFAGGTGHPYRRCSKSKRAQKSSPLPTPLPTAQTACATPPPQWRGNTRTPTKSSTCLTRACLRGLTPTSR